MDVRREGQVLAGQTVNEAPPSYEFQVRFLQQMQRILAEGSFVATYKFALLHALADLAVLKGDDSGRELTLSIQDIAAKFVELYWRQCAPFPLSGQTPAILKQNTGTQAAIIQKVEEARASVGGSLVALKRDFCAWQRLVRDVAKVVKVMPLWKLQTVGRTPMDFLYPNIGAGDFIALRPGIAYCLRAFHGLVTDLARNGWIRFLRQNNASLLGDRGEIGEFLFGADRNSLTAFRPILQEVQHGECFYCHETLRGQGDVDHFVPWSVYPVDLGHNFVLAHATCNRNKSDRLAAFPHIIHWCQRNDDHARSMAAEFDRQGLVYDLDATLTITRWSYNQVEMAHGMVWLRGRDELVRLEPEWRDALGMG